MLGHMRSSITDHHPQRIATRKSTRWGAILVVMAALVSAFAVAAQAGVVRPPVTGPLPKTLAPLTLVAPTPDLTAVANAFSSSHKSLEIAVTVKSGLALTNSVTIRITFINSAGVPKVITQCYVPSTGNRFVFHDIEGNGQPRRVGIQATLSQDKFRLGDAAGPSFTMPGPWYFDLDPLYDVTISHMGFFLRDTCGCYGDSDIHFEWFSPDDQKHKYDFSTSKGKNTFIEQFAWARTEVSAFARLHYPVYGFWTDWSICHPSGAYIEGGPGSFPLVPGVTRDHIEVLKEWHYQSCSAPIEYQITYHVHKYADDSPGGGGCFPSAIQLPAAVPLGGVKPPPVGPVKPPAVLR